MLLTLSIEQERFHQMINALRIRNEFYVGEVQKEFSKHRINQTSQSAISLKELVGERIYLGAMNGAREAFQHITKNNDSLPAVHNQLHQLANRFSQMKSLCLTGWKISVKKVLLHLCV